MYVYVWYISLEGAATSIFRGNKSFCRDKTRLLSRKKCACRDKRFAAKKVCLSRQNIFVATKHLSRQAYFLEPKRFVATSILVEAKLWSHTCLSRQKFGRDKHITFVETNDVFCRDKHMFVSTKRL